MKNLLKNIGLIIFLILLSNCNEKISYSGKILNISDDINSYKNKDLVISYLGTPNFIDPIEKKYFYYSEKKISKNFFNNRIIHRKLIVFHFNEYDSVLSVNQFDLDNENKIELIKDQTSSEIIQQGLIEKIFGGVGQATPSTN